MSYLKQLQEIVTSYNDINKGVSNCHLSFHSEIYNTIKPSPAFAAITIGFPNGERFRLRKDGWDDDKKLLDEVSGNIITSIMFYGINEFANSIKTQSK